MYEMKILKEADDDIQEMNHPNFWDGTFDKYDPRKVCKKHYDMIGYAWGYVSMTTAEDESMNNQYSALVNTHLGIEVG